MTTFHRILAHARWTPACTALGLLLSGGCSSGGAAGASVPPWDGTTPTDAADAVAADVMTDGRTPGDDAGTTGDGASLDVIAPPVDAGPFGCTVTGTLFSAPFNALDCVYTSTPRPGGVAADVIVTDFTGGCAVASTGSARANTHVLDIHFAGPAVRPGTYQVPADPVDVQYAVFGAGCVSPAGESANAGTVTVTAVDATGIAGTYDVTLNSDHITGSFHAPTCALVGGDGGCRM